MGLFRKNSKNRDDVAGEDTDLAVAQRDPLQVEKNTGFKMMDRQEIFAPDLTSPVIEALISENIESGRRGKDHYSITDVMKLISVIPRVSDSELVMVIRTIASFGVDVKAVIKEAIEKERLAQHRMNRLRQDIDGFKQKIKNSQEEIGLLEVGLVELVKSKDCLIKGVRLLKDSGASLPEKSAVDVQEVLSKVAVAERQVPEMDTFSTRVMDKTELAEANTIDQKKVQDQVQTKKKTKANTKAKRTTKARSKAKNTAKTNAKKVPVSNTAETVELTSINLDVKPISKKHK
ncbi:MAG: hypothetical protein OEY58_00890 [Gammaproteobacteria bacterium]|nr:hypothetical protein [Gammaproteobacteria bacterium]